MCSVSASQTFIVSDVAALPLDDASFDVAVSTFSKHHSSDAKAVPIDVARVLRPGCRALIWDLSQASASSLFAHLDPLELVSVGLLCLSPRDWRWPWHMPSPRLELAQARHERSCPKAVMRANRKDHGHAGHTERPDRTMSRPGR
jgi:ubiquinone/menaquinone biosynthesis C-methylase UbiE